jgi:hypothetical protein
MLCVLTTSEWFKAQILCGLLQAAGLDASVADEAMVRMNWLQAQALGGYRLMVSQSDFAAARELIDQYRRGELALDDDAACPNCGASERRIKPAGTRRAGFASIFLLGFPLPMSPAPDRVECAQCGNALEA